MTESQLDALCERADINEEEAHDALRTVHLLCAAPPHGIMLPKSEVANVLEAAATLYAAVPEIQGPGAFYKFVEDVATVLKQANTKQRARVSARPIRA